MCGNENQQQTKSKALRKRKSLVLGVAKGVAIGTAIGVATYNVQLWLSLGIAIGTAMGFAIMQKKNKDNRP